MGPIRPKYGLVWPNEWPNGESTRETAGVTQRPAD